MKFVKNIFGFENSVQRKSRSAFPAIFAGLMLLCVFASSCTYSNTNSNTVYNSTVVVQTNVTQPEEPDGNIVITVTDAAANMGVVSEITVTIDNVMVHSQADGWQEVSSSSQSFELLELKESSSHALLLESDIDVGLYDKISMEVSEVIITERNGTSYEADMPSETLEVNAELLVASGQTATASFDFLADKSLYKTQSNEYVFSPVIKLETRADAEVDTSASQDVEISGGSIRTNQEVGMDIEGNLVIGGRLPPILNITVNGVI